MSQTLQGVIAFSITPLRSDESVDEERLCSHIDELIAGGVDAVTLFGSTGAIGSFTEAERKRVVEVGLRHVAGRVPVMVGTGAITTAEALRLSEHAQAQGAAAALVVPISYWLLSEAELLAHYQAISSAITIPIAVYNSPRLTGIDMQPAFIARLGELPNVRYVKESSPDILRIVQTQRLSGGKLKVFAGRDDSALEALLLGADGWASGCANFMPAACRQLYQLARDPMAVPDARAMDARLRPLTEFAMAKGLVRTIHDGLKALGKPVGAPRRPIGTLSAEDFAQWHGLLRGRREALGF